MRHAPQAHDRTATALAEACMELQGFYAKTGQIIATRSDLFPPQYTESLACAPKGQLHWSLQTAVLLLYERHER